MATRLQIEALRILASVALLCVAFTLWLLAYSASLNPRVGCVLLIGAGAIGGLAIGYQIRWPKTCTAAGAILAVAYIAFLYAQITLLIPPNGD